MKDVLDWVAANPASAITIAYVLLSVLNGLLGKRGGWGAGLSGKLHLVLDTLSVLSRRDGAATLKLPGTKSR